jgi:hypothetical protein
MRRREQRPPEGAGGKRPRMGAVAGVLRDRHLIRSEQSAVSPKGSFLMPQPEAECAICLLLGQPTKRGSAAGRYRMTCQRCGTYEMEPDADAAVRGLRPDERPVFSHWVYEQNRLGTVPTITPDDIPIIRNRRRFSYADRTRLLIAYLLENTATFGESVNTASLNLQAALQQFDVAYINSIVQYLFQEKFLDLIQPFRIPARSSPGGSSNVALTPRGIMQAEEWGQAYTAARQGFVAMWFDDSLQPAWINGFDPGIRTAGYRPIRIDKEDYIGGISDQIMAEIRRSRFVVADYTGQRNGVYFEAGFALGLGLTVIPTCRVDEVPKLHFDIKHLNTLVWKTPAELAEGLNRRIRAVIGTGPDATDPK